MRYLTIKQLRSKKMSEAVMYAKYNQAGNKCIFGILSGMSNEEREKDRGSYYGSLSGLLRHIVGATGFFLGTCKTALTDNAAALKALDSLPPSPPEGPLTEAQWKEFGGALEAADTAYIGMAEAVGEAGLRLPVKLEWYGGNPDSVPISFFLSQLAVHNTHHRGQISQILDSLKIDNDYSGIDIAFLP
jgi:uncharacterized damage-inducible protein DinB